MSAATTAGRLRVTAIVPSYNAAAFIAEAIASIGAQTRPVDELLVVDDASRDDSAAAAEAAGATVIRLTENGGPSRARNVGIERARGDVVAFLDADDLWLPEHCALLVGALEAHPECVLAGGRTAFFGASTLEWPSPPVPFDRPYAAALPLLRQNVVFQTSAAARRSEIQAAGGYDPALRFSEDYDLWMRLAERGPFVHVPVVTARHRRHAGQASQQAERLVASAWRLRLRAVGVPPDDPGRAAETAVPEAAREALRGALDADFRDAWHEGARPAFDHLLAVGRAVPWLADVAARWSRRARLAWHAWHAARRVKRALRPQPAG